ncbi:GTP pyrophosphokinase [Synechocystis sp. PCC 7509]|uniref:GTP pyrophosphokinase n=1 Tax=Synechocystis sp. PCC 7509 TaxID=927677 RepID=UPI0002ABF70D|nr:hypothetical protein [Synechocystis sp. PCC 7509]
MGSSDFKKEENNFKEYYDSKLEFLKSAEASFKTLITALLTDIELESITSRLKVREECIEKFTRKYRKDLEKNNEEYEIKEHITDLIGIRVICLYEEDINKIKELLENDFKVTEYSDKTKALEKTENQFGYKSLHLDLTLNSTRENLPEYKNLSQIKSVEVQVRTIIQDAWSVLDHKLKYKKELSPNLSRRINRLAALFEIADQEFLAVKKEAETIEKNTIQNVNENKTDNQLNTFSFLEIIKRNLQFSGYTFARERADELVKEILNIFPEYKTQSFKTALENYFNKVIEFKRKINSDSKGDNNLNPYTMIRHALYLSDKEAFKDILYLSQRNSFDEWLQTGDR